MRNILKVQVKVTKYTPTKNEGNIKVVFKDDGGWSLSKNL